MAGNEDVSTLFLFFFFLREQLGFNEHTVVMQAFSGNVRIPETKTERNAAKFAPMETVQPKFVFRSLNILGD